MGRFISDDSLSKVPSLSPPWANLPNASSMGLVKNRNIYLILYHCFITVFYIFHLLCLKTVSSIAAVLNPLTLLHLIASYFITARQWPGAKFKHHVVDSKLNDIFLVMVTGKCAKVTHIALILQWTLQPFLITHILSLFYVRQKKYFLWTYAVTFFFFRHLNNVE